MKPCRECPFRRAAPAGYLGAVSGDPAAFLNSFGCGEARLPCHLAVDWEAGDVQEQARTAAPCAGALVFMINQHKVPRDRELAALLDGVTPDREHVFGHAGEFCQHHAPGCQVMVVGLRVEYTVEPPGGLNP